MRRRRTDETKFWAFVLLVSVVVAVLEVSIL
jgi:hypothetical protein